MRPVRPHLHYLNYLALPLASMRSTIEMDYFAVQKRGGLQIEQQFGYFFNFGQSVKRA